MSAKLLLPEHDPEASRRLFAVVCMRAGLPVAAQYTRTPQGACTCAEGATCKRPGNHLARFDRNESPVPFFTKNPKAPLFLQLGLLPEGSRLVALVVEGDAGRAQLDAFDLETAEARTLDGGKLLAFLTPPGLDLATLRPPPGLSVRVDGSLPLTGPQRWMWTRRGPIAALPEPLARLLATPAQAGEGVASPEGAAAASEAPEAPAEASRPEASAPVEAPPVEASPPSSTPAPSVPAPRSSAPSTPPAAAAPPGPEVAPASSSSTAPPSTPAPAPSTPPSSPAPAVEAPPPASSSAPSTLTPATAPAGVEALAPAPPGEPPSAASSSPPSTPPALQSSDPSRPPAALPAAAGEAPEAPAPVEPPSGSAPAPEASPAPPPAPLLAVLAHQHVAGWHRNPNAPRISYLDAAEAFTRHHPTDAHFAQYDAHETPWRLTLDGLPDLAERGGWRMVRLAIDVDHPWKKEKPTDDAGREDKRQRVEAWWADEQPKIAALLSKHPGALIYRSKSGGYRIVYMLARPFVVLSLDEKEAWRLFYRRELLYLARRFAIEGDPACADIGRIYRLPFVVPEGEEPTRPELRGDPAAIGVWGHEPSADELADDVAQARALAAAKPQEWGPVVRALAPERVGQEAQPLAPQDQDEARLLKRAGSYLDAMPPSIEGAHGDAALWVAALAAVRGFALGAATGAALLWQHFNPRCRPPWQRRDIERKCREAADRGEKPWGYLRDAGNGEAGLRHKPSERRQGTPGPTTTTDRPPTEAAMNEPPANNDDHQADEQPAATQAPAWPSPGLLVRRMEAAPARLPVGIAPIDAGWRGGAPAGLLWVIGGAPGAGKTSLATWLSHEWAKRGVPVAYIAGDEPRDGVLVRFGQQIGIERRFLEEGRPVALGDLAAHLDPLPLLVLDPDDDDGVGVVAVAAELRRRWPEGPAVLVVDSLQAMSRRIADAVADSPRAKVDAVLKDCKAAAKQHGLIILCLSELARSAYRGGPDQTLDIAATKESGGIEYECGALCNLRSVEGEKGLVMMTWGKSRPGRVEALALRQNYATASFTVEEAPQRDDHQAQEKAHTALMALVVDLVKRNPGLAGATAVCSRLATTNRGQRKQEVLAAVRELLETGALENRGTKVRPRLFWTGGEPAGGRPDDPPGSDIGSHGSHGSQTVPGNRTGEATRVPENRFPPPMGGTDLGTARRNRPEPTEAPQGDGNRSSKALAPPGDPSPTPSPTPSAPEPDEPPDSPPPTTSTPPPASIERPRTAEPPAPEPAPPAPLADPTNDAPPDDREGADTGTDVLL